MKTQNMLTLAIAGIIFISLAILVLKFLIKKDWKNGEDENGIKFSLSIWVTSLFTAISILIYNALNVFSEAINIIILKVSENPILEIVKIGSLYIGITFCWFLGCLYIVKLLSVIILGNRDNKIEMEQNNSGFFIIKGTIFISFICCLLSAFEQILRSFILDIDIPFYH